jgi:nucleoside-diphosphate-sugar epimerase
MDVFVTGATGYIGSAIVRELMEAGHRIVGLARSEEAARSLRVVGAEAHRGALDDLDSLRIGARMSDGVIHTAFTHDFSNLVAAAETDRRAIETLGGALEGSDHPFVVTSVTTGLPSGRVGTEKDAPDPGSVGNPRMEPEKVALAMASRGVRVSVLRLPPTVHSNADKHGFIPRLISIARAKGVSAYVGDGLNRWPAVHRLDAAHLFRLALEKGSAGARYHGVADEGVPFHDIADVIGRHLKIPLTAISPEEATDHFGWFAPFASINNPTSSALTQKQLDWHPVQPALIPDLEEGHYFNYSTSKA